MENKCTFVKSSKGNELLFKDGFLYMLNKKCNDVFYWSCIRKKSSSCGAAVTTRKDGDDHYVLKVNNTSHLHEPDQDTAKVHDVRHSLKRKAADSFDRPGQIIQKCIQNVPSTSAPYMPSKEAMRLVIHRERVRHEPSLPKTLKDFIVPEEFTKIEGEQFLIGHYIDDKDIILVFSTKQNLRLLDLSRFWIMDGTFQCCPDLFYQMYTIHGQVGQNVDTRQILPLVYGLLSSKTERAYGIFLQIVLRFTLNEINIQLNPETIITDFELAAIKASQNAFPTTQHKCCFFHLSQNIWKHIQKEGLSKKYISNSEFAHKMRHLAALAYLDPTEIPEAFEIIRDQVIANEGGKVTDWFFKYYVGGAYQRVSRVQSASRQNFQLKRLPPIFPPRMWSVLDCVKADIPTTQNNIENWHNRWNSLLNRKKMNIYKTLKELKKEQKNTIMEIERITANIKKRKNKMSNHLLKIKEHVLQKETMDLKEYLSGLAYIIYMKT